jgi:Tfp pilus assembly protein PilF
VKLTLGLTSSVNKTGSRPLANLSEAWIGLGEEYLAGPPVQEAYTKARAASDHALALSPDLASAHRARGDLLMTADLDWRGAEAEFRRALELQPSQAGRRFWRICVRLWVR